MAASRKRSSLPRSTLKPMDFSYEKLLNFSPVNPNNKLSNKESDDDFAKNFKIKLIDANTDNVIEEKNEDSIPEIDDKENKEKYVQITNNNNRKNTIGRDSNYIAIGNDGELSPIKGREKYLNESEMLPIEPNGETFLSKEEKLKKKLNETLLLMSKYLLNIQLTF